MVCRIIRSLAPSRIISDSSGLVPRMESVVSMAMISLLLTILISEAVLTRWLLPCVKIMMACYGIIRPTGPVSMIHTPIRSPVWKSLTGTVFLISMWTRTTTYGSSHPIQSSSWTEVQVPMYGIPLKEILPHCTHALIKKGIYGSQPMRETFVGTIPVPIILRYFRWSLKKQWLPTHTPYTLRR